MEEEDDDKTDAKAHGKKSVDLYGDDSASDDEPMKEVGAAADDDDDDDGNFTVPVLFHS